VPSGLAIATLPLRAACTRPGTPSTTRAQLERVAVVVVHAAQDHVDRLQAAQRLQVHAVSRT
jgi:hypothetical protein